VALNAADEEELHRLSSGERSTWNAAVSYYANLLIQRDLLVDRDIETIKNQLEDAETSVDLDGIALPPHLKFTLLRAAPSYRRHLFCAATLNRAACKFMLPPLTAGV
jgi:hypothetical protein